MIYISLQFGTSIPHHVLLINSGRLSLCSYDSSEEDETRLIRSTDRESRTEKKGNKMQLFSNILTASQSETLVMLPDKSGGSKSVELIFIYLPSNIYYKEVFD